MVKKGSNDKLQDFGGSAMVSFIVRMVAFAENVKKNNPTSHPVGGNPAVAALTERMHSSHSDSQLSQLTQRSNPTTTTALMMRPVAGVVKVFFERRYCNPY